MVKLVSPRGALLRIFGLSPEPQCFGPSEVGLHPDLLFLWLCTPFNTAFLAFKAFALASALGGAGTSFFAFGAIFMESHLILLSLFFFYFFCPTQVGGDFLAFWEV